MNSHPSHDNYFSGDYFMNTQTFSPEQVKALSSGWCPAELVLKM